MRSSQTLSTLACTLWLSFAATASAQDATQPTDSTEPPPTSEEATPTSLGSPFPPAFPGQTNGPVVTSRTRFQVTTIATGFNRPWAIAFLPDGRMLVTEKPTGKLYIVTQQGVKSPPVAGLPAVDGRDQGGLLDVEVGPDFATSRLIYWTYYEPRTGGNGLAVGRGRLIDGPQPRIDSLRIIFRMKPTLDSTMHAGGRMVFHPDGTLFVTLGERSILPGRVQARQLNSHFGKIVRINPDGTVPANNPFVNRTGARPEIYSLGHRNVLAAALDGQGRLWEVEMGPLGGDELNLVGAGKDYGWPTIGYGTEYSGAPIHQSGQGPGMEQPVYFWNPVISPSGMTIYSGNLFPEWKGHFFIGGLSSHALVRLVVVNDRVVGEERLKPAGNGRVREVVQGPEGALYLLTDEPNGRLLKMTPQGATP
ncbi:PQQ-dependent sugar dehydrogenase [Myxococcus stipitatus]|uniref:PQQ-dependent sugar dehydrogenase n=1 Tax=Myxococcus stipitatus TaxID=83455 RepID=UPI0030CCBBB4